MAGDLKAAYYPKTDRFYLPKLNKVMRPKALRALARKHYYIIKTCRDGRISLGLRIKPEMYAMHERDRWGMKVHSPMARRCIVCKKKVLGRSVLIVDKASYCSADCVMTTGEL